MERHCQLVQNTMTLNFNRHKSPHIVVAGSQTNIWLFFLDYHVEVWDFILEQKLYSNSIKSILLEIVVVINKTRIVYTTQQLDSQFFQIYDIETGDDKNFAKIDNQNIRYRERIFYGCFFKEINTGLFCQYRAEKARIFLWNLNQTQQQSISQHFLQECKSIKCEQYDQYGKYSITNYSNTFNLFQKDKEQSFIINMSALSIKSIKRYSQCLALLSVIEQQNQRNHKIIFFNIIFNNIVRVINLEYFVQNIICMRNYWIVVEKFLKNFQDQVRYNISVYLQNKLQHKISITRSIKINEIVQNEFIPLLLKTQQKSEFKIESVRLVFKKKFQLIHLLQQSGLVEVFGNQIVKQVVHHTL